MTGQRRLALADDPTQADTDSQRDLRWLVARQIRTSVVLHFGPNARELMANGAGLHLSGNEADTAADAALAAIRDAGYRLVRTITPEEEAEDARLWS